MFEIITPMLMVCALPRPSWLGVTTMVDLVVASGSGGLHNHKWPNTGPLAIFMPRHALICLDLASEGGFTTGESQLGPGQEIYSAKDIAFETKYKTPVLQMLYVPCYSFLGKHPSESQKHRRRVGIADRKVFARPESFCAHSQNHP